MSNSTCESGDASVGVSAKPAGDPLAEIQAIINAEWTPALVQTHRPRRKPARWLTAILCLIAMAGALSIYVSARLASNSEKMGQETAVTPAEKKKPLIAALFPETTRVKWRPYPARPPRHRAPRRTPAN